MMPEVAARIVVLASGSGTNLQAILNQVATGKLNANIVAVVSDNPAAYALERGKEFGAKTYTLDFKKSPNRSAYDVALENLLLELNADLVVLAGYMRILAASTVNAFAGRMLNVHPSLLPAYPGLDTYRRVLAAGDRWHGTTVHFVTPALDAGPAVAQYRIRIGPADTEPTLRKRVQAGEYIIYPLVIGWFSSGRLLCQDETVYLDQSPLRQPVTIYEA
jgi:phosphoribosylglycinamide formyltransferase-1